MTPDLLRSLLQGIAEAVIAQTEHLTALDQAIGDGDHGVNMKRGLENVLADLDNITAKPPAEILKAVGMTMVMRMETTTERLSGRVYSVFLIPRTLGPCRRLGVSMLTRQCALFLYLLTLRLLRPWSHWKKRQRVLLREMCIR